MLSTGGIDIHHSSGTLYRLWQHGLLCAYITNPSAGISVIGQFSGR